MAAASREQTPQSDGPRAERRAIAHADGERAETQPCPRCGHAMPALKGGAASICPNCGFKDSCCY